MPTINEERQTPKSVMEGFPMKDSEEHVKFKSLLNRILSVPREEILRREEEYKKTAQQNPKKRGPKPKGVK